MLDKTEPANKNNLLKDTTLKHCKKPNPMTQY